jgi:tRNA(Phe) wybutosine-synthesizing methylase Tyw3
MAVDHINGNPLDCRKCNLRIVTHKQNCQNIHVLNKANRSGYRNVGWCKSKNSWRILICVDGEKYCRYTKSKEEAIIISRELRRKLMPYATDC